MPTNSNTNLPRDQYQHYIPRFILRYFQDAQMRPKNRKERQKNFYKARKTGIDNETILMYDITSQTFEPRPIGKVYGVVNMYRDETNHENVDHLEQGLSRLENSAARVIRNISTASQTDIGGVRMTRRELGDFRKFIYLMHYRRVSLIDSYFDENDPDNAPLKAWMKNFKAKHNIRTKDGVWLFGVKYVLDTPHQKIVATGEAIQNKYGPQGMVKMYTTSIDLDINFHAVDYTVIAETFFLGIWEAADGEEFVMCSNSFGLWEGSINKMAECHRLFVVSPKIALVLRNNAIGPEAIESQRRFLDSTLADIGMTRSTCHYANQEAAHQDMRKYRQTPTAQDDIFFFTSTKLTPKQTHALNQILLLNMKVDGSVTFASTTAMCRSLQYHLRDDTPYARESKYWVRSLLGTLNSIPSAVSDETPSIDLVLGAIANGTIKSQSAYDRAYRVYHLATDDVTKYNRSSSEIHQMTVRAILKMREILPPPPLASRHVYLPFLCRDIVKELPKEESELFFALVGYQVDLFGVGPSGDDELSRIKYEAAIIGFTHWLAENKFLVLVDLLSPWVKVIL